jgi:4-methylaminobutanoate oxidase (formaldehyde-forming)
MTPGESPYESGLSFAVRLDKGDFLGRDALVEAGPAPQQRLACLTLADPRSVALGSEPVRVAGAAVGRVTSGGYGYTVGRSIAYASLPAEHTVPGTPVEVEIFGDWVAGEIAAEPLFDPRGERIRA